MKGRIIGREGRNIRAFETATGVDVIIDDTPDTVIVSCFDPIRREVARRVAGGADRRTAGSTRAGSRRSWPRSQKELEAQLVELGEQAAYDTGVHGLHPEMIKLIGRMRYRTSLRPEHPRALEGSRLARRHDGGGAAPRRRCWPSAAALLHDVGKVLTHDSEGTHVELGVEVARQVRRERGGDQLHPGPPRRRAPRDRGVGAGAGGRRDQRLAPGRPARGVRDLREAARPGWRRSPTASPGWRRAT